MDTVELGGASRDSTGFGAMEEGLISSEVRTSWILSLSDSNHRVPADLGQESHASSWVEEWNSACLSICSWSDRPFVELYVENTVFSRLCTGLSVPLHVLASSTGLPSKRCLGIGFLSLADREIQVFWNVAPYTRLRLEFTRETSLILRFARKAGNPFQTTQGNRLCCDSCDQEGRRVSDEVVPGTSVFPSSETGMSGNFWGHIKGAKYRFVLHDRTRDYS